MSNIINTTLDEVCDFVGGSQPAKKFFINSKKQGYIRLIQIRDYKTDTYITYIPEDSTRKFCSKTDIMIGRYGPPIFQILRGIDGAYNVALMKAIPKENITNNYLYYFLTQEHLFEYVNALSPRTGGQTGVDVVMLKQFPIQLPELEEQKKIAKVLSDLDVKIDINNKINQELEAMAKTLYDYWFVQFDFPDANSKPYKSSGGKMVFNEELKREIPFGWESGILTDIADITMGQSPSGSSYNENKNGTVFYQGSTDFGSRFPTVRKYTTEPSRIAEKGDILLSVRAPVGTLNQAIERCCIGRGLAALREKEGSISFLWSQMEYFKQIFDRRNSSGTTFGSITKDDLFSLKVCIPKKEVLKEFKKIADPLHNKIIVNSKQNQKLSELRDWLLPMLMNGQITVVGAETAVSSLRGTKQSYKENASDSLGLVAEEREEYRKS
ncbi:restriction endonuclease subunit S [Polaribacter sp. IC073]|uniref:restriction endonuclease subunit S n=1 Tax=Polaribacter sp. IC073 TaxID=2508540 RepID=UPI0011BE79B0|nr:restriction endonuclease subunit S [Polaribacter sp. IC073]TXD49211.1 hypothetical protein ES045_03865 [Polaribacter sp. IC073]